MNTEQFETILESRLSSIKQVLGNKAKEYAIGDRLYNFKRAAEISRTTPQQALAGMFMKHLVSVLDLVEGSISPTEYMVNEKIGDAINYLILLEAILKEPVVNMKCVECGECSNAEIPERQKIAALENMEAKERARMSNFLNLLENVQYKVDDTFRADSDIVLFNGNTLEGLKNIEDNTFNLIITSPPYNIGKEYETQVKLDNYIESIQPILKELVRVLALNGSLCWQVGNYVDNGEVFPLDMQFYPIFKNLGLQLRNRVIWTFEHGLHCSLRFSGRYETLLWFTKTKDYTFNLDPIRVPSKYPGKTNFKPGPKYGLPSGNPLGKNPSDVWKLMAKEWETGIWNIPNVKANHPEKTIHPCQFPIELIERCVLSMTNEGDYVLDPFCGVGSSILAAVRHNRRAMGCDKEKSYIDEAKKRIDMLFSGELPYRPIGKPVHKPTGKEKVSQIPIPPKGWKHEG